MTKKICQIIEGNKRGGYRILKEFDNFDYDIDTDINKVIAEVKKILIADVNGMDYIFNENKWLWTHNDKFIRIEIFTIHSKDELYDNNA